LPLLSGASTPPHIFHFQAQPEKLSYKSSSTGTTPSSERKHELGYSTEPQVDSADEVMKLVRQIYLSVLFYYKSVIVIISSFVICIPAV
jgi:hypothetical protein